MIIAIDGPAGAGKSTVAELVARELGLTFLDTGAMYRAVTLRVLDSGAHPSDEAACTAVARSLRLEFDDEGHVLIDGVPGEPDIRSRTVTLNVSAVSAHPGVRSAIVARQRELARAWGGLVAEGRDIGTVVFPHADYKFFLDASAEERAKRRALQEGEETDVDSLLADIKRRDRLDSTRAHSPLRQAEDAIPIDTEGLDAEAVARAILHLVGPADRGRVHPARRKRS